MSTLTSLWRNRWVRVALVVVVVVLLVAAPLSLPLFANQTLVRIGVYAVAVLGLNLVMGYAGQVNLGQIFFVGLGAYVTAFGVTHGWNVVLVFVAACLLPGVAGLLVALAAARLGGLAIAMVTIALPIVGVPLAKRLSDVTGGSQGMSARFSGAPDWSGLYDDQWQYYILLVVTAAAFLLARNLVRGKFGRALAVVRRNEAVAASVGVSPYRYKVLAFTLASVFGGASGFLYLVAVQYTSPETMSFGHSIELVAAMVVGGAGSVPGSLIGGAYYVFVPQFTNSLDPNLTAIGQGVILLVVLFVLPGGLVSLPRVIRRLVRRRSPQAASPWPEETERQAQA
ncbi:branched-chain amino acid transport system permease protein [Amycolatopsis bartoniae]|uniref:Branched-chain amino acid ABC transporter permease n=1 Tax=Amycolatopsis bartoniae TaxID=941986 RepID=A0A8H9J160_9PSEU|nr:branched-chain amino acid ABC transporter permease [Amycolatopsis bartoniae]MBB2935562.1 branched-chain amino acid transport system permease protein [Amycolatopsis bartoniae]TVT05253.1 branched-chain amino acid ABC transporter permease [Amycolatopsis bartoniae]GHF76791.1 branched-chain amino acid ABC transporter permease [Amycolatopsis bartoniae]